MDLELLAERSYRKLMMDIRSMDITPGPVSSGMIGDLLSGQHASEEMILQQYSGWDIVRSRSLAMDAFFGSYFGNLMERHDLSKGIALFAVGGYGRQELSPSSDIDLQVFYSGIPDNHPILREFCLTTTALASSIPGIWGHPVCNSIDEIGGFRGVQGREYQAEKLFSLHDLRRIGGDVGVEMAALDELRSGNEPFELLLAVLPALNLMTSDPARVYSFDPFNIKGGVGGLRHFQKAVFAQAALGFRSSSESYKEMSQEVLTSVGILHKVRAWVNTQARIDNQGNECHSRANDDLTIDRLRGYRRIFGGDAVSGLVEARKCIMRHAETVILGWNAGIPVNGCMTYCPDGLSLAAGHSSPEERYRLLLEAQSRGIPVSLKGRSQFAGGLPPSAAFLDLLRSPGEFSPTLDRLMACDSLGALLPGWSQVESSLFESHHVYGGTTRAGRALARIKNLDKMEQDEILKQAYASLSPDALLSIRLALLYKGAPEAAGATPHSCLAPFREMYSLGDDGLRRSAFLIRDKNLLFDALQESLLDDSSIGGICSMVKDPVTLDALALFTAADRGLSGKELADFVGFHSLCGSFMKGSHGRLDPSRIDPDGNSILDSLPVSYAYGRYSANLVRDINDLLKVSDSGIPSVRTTELQFQDRSALLTVAAPDFPGLFWRMAGCCLGNGVGITQADIYSLKAEGLALDYLEVRFPDQFDRVTFRETLSHAISSRHDCPGLDPGGILEHAYQDGRIYSSSLESQGPSFRLRLKGRDHPGLLYAVTRILSEETQADICRINAYTGKHGAVNDIFIFSSPLKNPGAMLKERFRDLVY